MKVTVTHLKAPWPAGAVIGSVVEIPYDAMPSFLAGKCSPAAHDAEVAHTLVLPDPVVATAVAAAASVGSAIVPTRTQDDLAAVQNLLAEARTEADELRSMLAKAQEQLQALGLERDAAIAERDTARADLAKAQEQLQAASAKGSKAK